MSPGTSAGRHAHRHSGHVGDLSSHVRIHARWNPVWPQGNDFSASPGSNATKHTAHSSGPFAFFFFFERILLVAVVDSDARVPCVFVRRGRGRPNDVGELCDFRLGQAQGGGVGTRDVRRARVERCAVGGDAVHDAPQRLVAHQVAPPRAPRGRERVGRALARVPDCSGRRRRDRAPERGSEPVGRRRARGQRGRSEERRPGTTPRVDGVPRSRALRSSRGVASLASETRLANLIAYAHLDPSSASGPRRPAPPPRLALSEVNTTQNTNHVGKTARTGPRRADRLS